MWLAPPVSILNVTNAATRCNQGRTDSDSLSVSSAVQDDADLRRVVTAWPMLPESVQAGIVAMVAALNDRICE